MNIIKKVFRRGEFEMYMDKNKKWRFRLKAPNGEIIASSEAYSSYNSCYDGAKSVKRHSLFAKIFKLND